MDFRLISTCLRKSAIRPGWSSPIAKWFSGTHGDHNLPRVQISHSNPFVSISEEIREAVENVKPVVALETTIYTHGFPYPENVALASHLESVVRLNGAVPATIGILNGIARIGLGPDDLIELTASAGKPETRKISRRDLGYICGMGQRGHAMNGGTTVSGTMLLAELAGIQVFATGGLGGVHRGGENTMDISADLTELGRTGTVVVSSGCKSFLDIPRTLEYLETQGVGVMTFADGREGDVEFPAFWTRESGVKSPFTLKDEAEAAAIAFAQRSTAIKSGLLFANPISSEHSLDKGEMDVVISQAIRDAQAAGYHGSDNTPFVLKRIREITQGGSVAANRALIESNVARGTKVAVELSKLQQALRIQSATSTPQHTPTRGIPPQSTASAYPHRYDYCDSLNKVRYKEGERQARRVQVVVAGSLAMDLSCNYLPSNSHHSEPATQTSNPASISQNLGGVGRNVATALQYMDVSTRLCSKVGNDIAGRTALAMLEKQGLQTSGILTSRSGARTAQYVAINNAKKALVMAMADMDILEDVDSTTPSSLSGWASARPDWLVVDANWNPKMLQAWLQAGKSINAKIAFEPVSVAKSKRLFQNYVSDINSGPDLPVWPSTVLDLATPNGLELAAMNNAARDMDLFQREDWFEVIDAFRLPNSGSRDRLIHQTNMALVDQGIPQQAIQLLPFIPTIVTTLGPQGVLLTSLLRPGDDRLTSPEAAPYLLSRPMEGNRGVGGVYMRLYSTPETVAQQDIVSVNGIGDTFLGVLIAGLTQNPDMKIEHLVNTAQEASALTLKSEEAVSPNISSLSVELSKFASYAA